MVDRFHVAAEFLGFNVHTVMTVLLGFCVWIVEGGVIVIACRHYGLGPQSLVAGYLTLAIVNFGLLIPSTPGNVGVYQYMTIRAEPVWRGARYGTGAEHCGACVPICADNAERCGSAAT